MKKISQEKVDAIQRDRSAGWTLENIAWDIGGCTEDEVMEVIRRNKGKMEWT